MGKGHRDNHKARLKRGTVAFEKKKKRRALDYYHLRCITCGGVYKRIKIISGLCPICRKRMGILD
jgi:hypothetical protein